MNERISYKVEWRIVRFRDKDGFIACLLREGMETERVKAIFKEEYLGEDIIKDNIALDEGMHEVALLITGIGGTAYDSSNAHLGIGDGTDAEDKTQTGLMGTNKVYLPMDAGYPIVSGTMAEWRSTADSSTANFDWNEFSLCNSNDETTGANFNRKVVAKGTKNEGETWVLTLRATFVGKVT